MLTPEIKEQRAGKVTGSQVDRIMAGWNEQPVVKPETPELIKWIQTHQVKPAVKELKPIADFEVNTKLIDAAWKYCQSQRPPAGMLSYAHELACDELFFDDPSKEEFQTQDMINGHERELDAIEALEQKLGIEYLGTGDHQTHFSEGDCGVTPDGYSLGDLGLPVRGAEVKSRVAKHHAAQLKIKNNLTLCRLDFARYCQIMLGMHVLDVQIWDSVNFNPFAKRSELRLHHVVIKRDQGFINIMLDRVAQTIRIKNELIKEFNGIADAKRELENYG